MKWWALCIHAITHVKVEYNGRDLSNNPTLLADAQYGPATCSTSYPKNLFAEFHQNTISYTKDKDFNQDTFRSQVRRFG